MLETVADTDCTQPMDYRLTGTSSIPSSKIDRTVSPMWRYKRDSFLISNEQHNIEYSCIQ